MVDASHRTAIARKCLSAPAKRLLSLGLLRGRLFDYGCGRGTDCEILGIGGWDPYWRPGRPGHGWDTAGTGSWREKRLEKLEL
jgi:hypothetical protein